MMDRLFLLHCLDEDAVPARRRRRRELGAAISHDPRRRSRRTALMAKFGEASPEPLGSGKIAGAVAFQRLPVSPGVGAFDRTGGTLLVDEFVNGKCVILALYPDPVELAEHEAIGDRRRRAGTDDDAAAVILGDAFEPGSDIHGLADCRIVVAPRCADIADHGWARVETD